MSDPLLDAALHQMGIPTYVSQAHESTLGRAIASTLTDDTAQDNPERLPRLGFLYESQGIAAYQRWVMRRDGQVGEDLQEARLHFLSSFYCWRSLASLPDDGLLGDHPQNASDTGVAIVGRELSGEPISPHLALAFRIAVSGLLAERTAETRLELRWFTPEDILNEDWRCRVSAHVFSAFVLLTRKSNAWDDIDSALRSIDELRDLQRQHEDQYIDGSGQEAQQVAVALELVGLYHLAQMITIAGEYLRTGRESLTQVGIAFDRHLDRASIAFETGRHLLLVHMARLLWAGCHELVRDSIWTHASGLGEQVRQFAELLASRGRPQPVIELWPRSCQQVCKRGLQAAALFSVTACASTSSLTLTPSLNLTPL